MKQIQAPAGYVPAYAIAFGSIGADAAPVDATHPLPVEPVRTAASSTALSGSSSAASATLGPFVPQLGRALWVTLSGVWAGTVRLLRSTDGGATRLPLTVAGQPWASFTANANEPVVEPSDAAATFYLEAILSSGTLIYRVAQ